MTTAGYSGTPLPRKLGIKPGARVLLVGAPPEVELGPLPPGARLHTRAGGSPYDVVLVFVTASGDLARRLPALIGRLATAGGLWVCWPKRTSGVPTDLDENLLREIVLATGLVDNKVCAVDQTWSGLRFVRRRHDRPDR